MLSISHRAGRVRQRRTSFCDPRQEPMFLNAHLAPESHDWQQALAAQFIGPLEGNAEATGYFIHVEQTDVHLLALVLRG
jgi:hypothetical protein